MVRTIGNPLTWGAEAVAESGRSMGEVAQNLGSHADEVPVVNTIGIEHIRDALRKGVDDFSFFRSDVLFLIAIYPIIGICMAFAAFNMALVPLVFPMAAGFALIGPVAAVGLYELSRQREAGIEANWGSALHELRSRVLGPVFVLGLYLLGVFVVWMYAAALIYGWTLGPAMPATISGFLGDTIGTSAGWAMILVGCAVGFVFACIVLVTAAISFPMLIDRRIGLPVAVATSIRVAQKNPATIACWGLVVAAGLVVGSIPLFLGLIIVMPVLGHATWHLYRAAVSYVPREDTES